MPRRPAADATPRLVRIPGRRPWYIRWSEPGSRRSQVVSTSTEDEAEARLVLADWLIGRTAPPQSPTIRWFLDQRAAQFQTTAPDGTQQIESRIRSFHARLSAYFGDYRPDQLSEALLRRYLGTRPPSAGRREMEELRAAIPTKLRACDFPLPAPRPPRERFLSRDEARALLAAAQTHHVQLFILLGMTTGQRAGSILDLTWDRVQWDAGVLDFRNPDKGENRKRRGVCPVDARVMATLREAREVALTDHVIEYNGQAVASVKKAFERAAIAAGLCEPTGRVDAKGKPLVHATASPHTMKHSVISWLAMDGWTVDAIADFTSTDEKTVKRIYRKVNPGYLRDLATTLGDGLLGDGLTTPFQAPKRDKCLHRRHKSKQAVTA